jgi:hypothetical protein
MGDVMLAFTKRLWFGLFFHFLSFSSTKIPNNCHDKRVFHFFTGPRFRRNVRRR